MWNNHKDFFYFDQLVDKFCPLFHMYNTGDTIPSIITLPLDCNTMWPKSNRLFPSQDVYFFYTHSHLSALQNCALLFSTNFLFIFIFKECITQFSHWIVSCTIFFKNILQLFIKFPHSFVTIELLTFCKNAKNNYCSRELSLFWLNK